jgi:primosomal protein N' (replication factor Y)
VAGRAGRGERPGRVVVQTYTPDHYAIDHASRHDYEGFAAQELHHRRVAGYPPYSRLARLMYGHVDARKARDEALRMAKVLTLRRAELGSDVDVLGPSRPYVQRLRGRYRWQIILRGRDPSEVLDPTPPPDWTIDIDPITLA